MKNTKNSFILLYFVFLSSLSYSANFYWVNGTGNWSDRAGHWRTSSGGSTIPATVPGQNDDVIFDANSFTATGQKVFLNSTAQTCRNMNWTGANYNPSLDRTVSTTLNIYGSLNLISAMTINTNSMKFEFNGNGSITSNGVKLPNTIEINTSGTISLQDNADIENFFILTNGSFVSNSYDIKCFQFNTLNTNIRTLDLGSSTINTESGFLMYTENLNHSSSDYTINFTNPTYLNNINIFGSASASVINIKKIICSNKENGTMTLTKVNIETIIYKGSLIINGTTSAPHPHIQYLEIDSSARLNNTLYIDSFYLTNNLGANVYEFGDLFYSGRYDTIRVLKYASFNNGTCKAPNYISSKTNPNNYHGVLVIPNNLNLEYYSILNSHVTGSFTYSVSNASGSNSNINGWTLTPGGRKFYWVNNSGNWNDPTHWAFTSGGTGQSSNGCIPNMYDSVYFDGNSFNTANSIVTLNQIGNCAYMDWTGATNDPSFTANNIVNDLHIYGSIILNSNMTWTPDDVYLNGTNNTYKITSNGNSFEKNIYLDALDNGIYELTDNIYIKKDFHFYAGSLFTNNHEFKVNNDYFVNFSINKFLKMGSSKFIIEKGNWMINTSNYTHDYGTSTIQFLNQGKAAGTGSRLYNGGSGANSLSYYKVEFLGQKNTLGWIDGLNKDSIQYLIFRNNAKFEPSSNFNFVHYLELDTSGIFHNSGFGYKLYIDSAIFNNIYGNNTYSFGNKNNDTVFFNQFWKTEDGNCANPNQLMGFDASNQAKVKYSGGVVNFNYFNILNIKGLSPGTYNANNVGVSENNTGFSISSRPGRKYYWVGNSGNWNDPTHWALSSGGSGQSVSGCIPNRNDSVYFDANSFSASNSIVSGNVLTEFGHMDWTGATNNPTFQSISGNQLNCYGSLHLIRQMKWMPENTTFMASVSGNYHITSNGQSFKNDVDFNSNANYYLNDTFFLNYYSKTITIKKGGFYTNNHPMYIYGLTTFSSGNPSRTVNLGNSNIFLQGILTSNNQKYAWGNLTLNYSVNANITGNVSIIYGPGQTETATHYQNGSIDFPANKQNFKIKYIEHKSYVNIGSSNNNSYFDTIEFVNINCYSNSDYLQFSGTGKIFIKKFISNRGMRSTSNNLEFDSLILTGEGINSPIVTHHFPSNKTTRINQYLLFGKNKCIRTIVTSSSTANANIYVPSGIEFNTDFLDISKLSQTGPGIFNAGANSQVRTNTVNILYNGPSYTSTLNQTQYCYVNNGSGCGSVTIQPKLSSNYFFWRTVPPMAIVYSDTNVITRSFCGIQKHLIISNYGTNCIETDTIYVYPGEFTNNTTDSFHNNSTDSNWYNCANWHLGKYPDSTTNVRIRGNKIARIKPGEIAYCKDLVVENGGKLIMKGGTLYVYGDIEGLGSDFFIGDSGKVVFIGGDTQKIKSNIASFYLVDINKWRSIVLFEGVGFEVSKHIEFNKGIIRYNTGGSLEIKSGGTSSEGNPLSFAACEVRKYGSDDFVFPTGKGNVWARCAIVNRTGSSAFRAEYFDNGYGLYDTLHPLTNVSVKEYWDIEPDGPETVNIKLYWEDAMRSGIDLSQDSSDLKVAHFNSFTNKWENAEGNNIDFNFDGSLESDPFSDYSPFTFGSTSLLIPLNKTEFLNFNVWKEQGKRVLDFKVNEVNMNDRFEIERSINDKGFVSINSISVTINSMNQIRWIDNEYMSDEITIKYRIKWIQNDGKIKYSYVKMISPNKFSSLSIYPNPNNGSFQINSHLEEIVQVKIYNSLGQEIEVNKLQENSSLFQINSTLNTGIYTVVVYLSNNEVVHKIINVE